MKAQEKPAPPGVTFRHIGSLSTWLATALCITVLEGKEVRVQPKYLLNVRHKGCQEVVDIFLSLFLETYIRGVIHMEPLMMESARLSRTLRDDFIRAIAWG